MTVRLYEPPKGMHIARAILAQAVNGKNYDQAAVWAARRWGETSPAAQMCAKAVVAGGSIGGSTWGDDIAYQRAVSDLIEAVRNATILGRLQGLVRVPLNTRINVETSKPSAYWVGEGKGKAILQWVTEQVTLRPLKVAAATVITSELANHSDPAAEDFVRRGLIKSLAEKFDASFAGSGAGSAGVEPAGVLFGITPVPAGGSNLTEALREMVNEFTGDLTRAFWVAQPETFVAFAGADRPNIGMRGGEMLGAPALASKGAPPDSLLLIDPGLIVYGQGETEQRVGPNATMEMVDPTSQNAITGQGTTLVSMFQTNCVAIIAEQEINWDAQAGAVHWVNQITSSGSM